MALKTECEHTEQFILCWACEPKEYNKSLRDDEASLASWARSSLFPTELEIEEEEEGIEWEEEEA